jgi:hypothetical protein
MKVLTVLLILLAIGVGLTVAIPVLSVALVFGVILGGFAIWLLPILIIATSDKTTGGEKFAWILAIIFLSWFAWIFYFLLAPLKPKPIYERRYYRDYRYD